MHILVTNDDGIYAPGIRALASALRTLGTVSVVAPDRERSATGHAITVHRPLRARHLTLDFADLAYAVDGTPADCVKLALEAQLITRPDIVVSGINRGANLGTDVLYSGTVSAAIEAAMLGLPAIAISLADVRNTNYEPAAEFASYLARTWQSRDLPPDTLLNVNWPKDTPSQVFVTNLGRRRYSNSFDKRQDPLGRDYFWMCNNVVEDLTPHTDVWAIAQGHVSVSPIHFDLTNYQLVAEVGNWQLTLP